MIDDRLRVRTHVAVPGVLLLRMIFEMQVRAGGTTFLTDMSDDITDTDIDPIRWAIKSMSEEHLAVSEGLPRVRADSELMITERGPVVAVPDLTGDSSDKGGSVGGSNVYTRVVTARPISGHPKRRRDAVPRTRINDDYCPPPHRACSICFCLTGTSQESR